MADKKISALATAAAPLDGTEVLPIVQTGSTVKVSVDNLTAGRTVSMSKVGVGTTSPVELLQVQGNGDYQARIVGGTGQNAGLALEGNATGTRAQVSLRSNNGTPRDYVIRNVSGTFSVLDNTASTTPVTIEAATPSNAVYVNASGNVGFGTASPAQKVDVVGSINVDGSARKLLVDTSAASGSLQNRFTIQSNVTNSNTSLNVVPNGTSTSTSLQFFGNPDPLNCSSLLLQLFANSEARVLATRTGTGSFIPLKFYTSGAVRMEMDVDGNIVTGTAALATTATNGFFYVPTCAGTPTGVPTAKTGVAPIVIDTTNNKLYFYSGGSWRDAGP